MTASPTVRPMSPTPPTSFSQPESLYALQGLRALAALLVVCDHAIATLIVKAGAARALEEYAYFVGLLGVSIFFTISGFVMIFGHFDDFNKPHAPRHFMLKRIGRIVPLYWLTSLIYYAKLVAAGSPPSIFSLVLSLFFIPHQEPGQLFGRPVYSLGWTLEYEMSFYAIFALALYFRFWIGIGIIAGTLVGLVLLTASGILLDHVPIVSFLGDPIVLFFLGGVAVGLARRKFLDVIPRPRFGFAVVIALGLIAASCGTALLLGPKAFLSEVLQIVCCFGSVAACSLAVEGSKRGALEKSLKKLGDATYSIYLTHPFVVGPAGRIVGRFFPQVWPTAFVLFSVLFAAIIGILTYKYIEKPMVATWGSFLNRWSGRNGRRVEVASS